MSKLPVLSSKEIDRISDKISQHMVDAFKSTAITVDDAAKAMNSMMNALGGFVEPPVVTGDLITIGMVEWFVEGVDHESRTISLNGDNGTMVMTWEMVRDAKCGFVPDRSSHDLVKAALLPFDGSME